MTSGVITSAPLVGISCYRVQAQFGAWDLRAALLPDRYVAAVTAAGGVPVLLPPVPLIEATVGRLDALVLA
nr:gamma-glutamyl-gamma-aminobutyrate hydrolase family protein [Actinomycetota bacterium]